ncbi:TRM11 family methyltransferase [Streptomyces sp. ISL-100]|uniref:TRM11 family SAM-dependent methyltransferase n=1 Tax=Streptomyces sp. ISL-100 TaxID=2819173 RepID=UPI001BE5A6F0|nr:DNA methyltransferase [Streptomyces sp. ISL-100]MBT2396664.1 site-specific DNA-methyltransferase [Streptomyces sp. ISL-100]
MNTRPLSVWNTAPTSGPAQRADRYVKGSAAHPAKMLPAIARHAIQTYTQAGGLVLDPMCGIGTTLVEAVHLGRYALGCEYEPQWAHLAEANLRHADSQGASGGAAVFCGDARQLVSHIPAHFHGTVDLIVTSPPYGPSVHGQVRSTRESGERGVTKRDYRYSTDRHNLAHVGLDALLEGFTDILTQCRHLLRPGGHAVITTRPWRERGELIDLPSAALAAAENAGLIPVERNIALLAGIRDGRLIPRPSFFQMKNVGDARRTGLPLALIAHEDALVAVRPEMPPAARPGSSTETNGERRCATRSSRKPATPANFRSRTCAPKVAHGGQ